MFDLDNENLGCCSNNNSKHISNVVDEYLQQLEYEYQNPETPRGLCTGIKELDNKLDGFKGGELILLAARPAMGKSYFAINCAYNIAKNFYDDAQKGKEEKSVLFFSFEAQPKHLIARFVGLETQTPTWQLREYLNPELFEKIIVAGRKISKLPLHICEDYGCAHTIDKIKNYVSNFNKHGKISFIVIDYLQLLFFEKNEYTTVLHQLKNLALFFNVPILILSQLNRGLEKRKDKRPLMSDLFSFSKDLFPVDKILFLYREYYYLLHEEPKKYSKETTEHFEFRMEEWEKECRNIQNKCEIIIAENKNGKIGVVKCFFDKTIGKFDNLERDDEYLPKYIG